MSAISFDDRDALFGALQDHHLRIGDSQFYVPPTAITVTRRMKNDKIKMLRGRGSFIKNSGYFDLIIEVSLFFPDMQSINWELRTLIAQLKKCPFLPIENTLLNDVYDVEAITVAGVSVTTIEGFPGALQAQLQLYKFNPYAYIYDDSERSYEEMFNWPLFRWYYQRNLNPNKHNGIDGQRFVTYYEPLESELYNEYMFKIASEEDLSLMKTWRQKRDKLIKKWMDEKGAGLANNTRDYQMFGGIPIPGITLFDDSIVKEIDEVLFNKQLNDLYKDNAKNVLEEYQIQMDNWDIPGLILESLAASYENSITSVQLQAHESPTHQYMGSQDMVFIAKFVTEDIEALTSLEQMVRRSTYLNREYHQFISNGFIQFDHQLLRLFGVNYVVIEDMVSSTREGTPGVYDITLTLTSYNRSQSRLAETQRLSEGIKWDIPLNSFMDIFSSPMAHDFLDIGSIGSSDVKRKALYDAKVKSMFKKVELYPDLELPTYKEVKEAGFTIPDLNEGEFVDPDFFLMYDDPIDYSEQATQILNSSKGMKTELRDTMNGKGTVVGNQLTLDDQTQFALTKDREQQKAAPTATGTGESSAENLSSADMEILIRKIADDQSVPQELALAMAKTFDPNLRQFYTVGRGTNKTLGDIEVTEKNIPIMMTSRNQFFADPELVVSASYIGVMRVSPLMGDAHLIANSIEQNVTVAMKTLKYYLDAVNAGELINDNTLTAFGLSGDVTGYTKAQWAGAISMYLGFTREFNQLFNDNKKMPTTITSLVSQILNLSDTVGNKTSQQVQAAFKQLPVPDYKKVNNPNSPYSFEEKLFTEEDFEDHELVFQDHFHDLKKYDRRGRLVRAFPTFFLIFIDEGQFIGTVKLSDQYYGYRAITDITFSNSRKSASSTLIMEMANVFGNLTDASKGMDLTHSTIGDLIMSQMQPGSLAEERESLRSRNRDPNWYKSIYLRTGARIHLRMGYGSNPMNLPTTMNGTITSIQNNGETVQVIAQDDGIELTNKLKAAPDEQTRKFFFSAQEPTEIVDELLTDHQNWFLDVWSDISNAEYQKHSLGIMHFGMPGRPISHYWWEFSELQDRPINEITMNIYSTTGKLRTEANGLWASLGNFFGIGKNDEDGINMNLYDKSVWDVLSVISCIGEDMILAVHPFDFRNTIFMGKPYFPLGYEYAVDGDTYETRSKPFRQYHIYDSWTSIVDNSIIATEDNMYTVAVGVFNNEGNMDTTQAIYVDTNIWPEKQKTVMIDTHMNAQGVRLVEHIPLIGHLLNKPLKWYYDEWTAIKIAAAGLRDYVKEMYDGYLTVMGDPSVKPYNQFYMNDTFTDMTGPAEVREVNQLMNFEVGFITMIKPDCVVVNSDKTSVNFLAGMTSVAANLIAVYTLRGLLRNRGYEGAYPIMNATWASVKRQWGKLTGKMGDTLMNRKVKGFDNLRKTGPSSAGSSIFEYDPVTGEVREFAPITSKMEQRWTKSGILKEFLKNLKDFDTQGMKDLFSSVRRSMAGKAAMGYDISKLAKLRGKMSTIMKMGKIGRVAKWGARGVETVVAGAEVLSGPPGWLALLIETIVFETLVSGIREFIDRFTFTRKAVIITPLKKDGIEFTAGINGHMGSVVGDSPDMWQAFLNGPIGSLVLGFLGSDAADYGATGVQAEASAETLMNNVTSTFINTHRKRVIVDPEVENRYKLDMDLASQDMTSKKKEDDSLASKLAQYGEDARKLFSLDTLTGWIKNIFSSDSSSGGEGVDPSSFTTMDLNQPSGISAAAIDKAFAGTPLAGTGKYYVQLEKSIPKAPSPMLNVTDDLTVPNTRVMSGLYLAAHSALETGWGTSRIFRDKHNLFGYGAYDGSAYQSAYTFKSVEDCVNYAANKIKDNYLTKGGKYYSGPTLKGMNVKYASDKGWADKIASIMAKIAKNDPNFQMPSEGHATVTGEIPTVVGSAGYKKYHIATASEASKQLLNLKTEKLQHVKLTLVSEFPYIRKASLEMVEALGAVYKSKVGDTLAITSAYRENDPYWHGTGFAVDVDTPNCGIIAGAYRFPKGSKEKQNLMTLAELALQVGFDDLYMGDVDVAADLKKKYPSKKITQRNDHYNHLHLAYPTK